MRVVLDRNRGGSYLSSLLVGAGLLAMFLFLTYYFQGNLRLLGPEDRLRLPAVLGSASSWPPGVVDSCCPGSGPGR